MSDLATLIPMVVAGVGVVLIWIGWSRRVSLDELYCRRCAYRIDPGGADRCSECGNTLSDKGIIAGRVSRFWPLIAAGVLLIAAPTAVLGLRILEDLGRIELVDYPSWYLLRADIASANNYGDESVMELRRRHARGRLSESAKKKFADLLARRSVNLFGMPTVPQSRVDYSGMTLSLLRDYKPTAEVLDEMFAALLDFDGLRLAAVVPVNSPGTVEIVPRTVVYRPSHFRFDTGVVYPALVGRPRLISATQAKRQLTISGGVVVDARLAPRPGRWFDKIEPLVLGVEIDWFMVNVGDPAFPILAYSHPNKPRDPRASRRGEITDTPAAASGIDYPVWHTSVFDLDMP